MHHRVLVLILAILGTGYTLYNAFVHYQEVSLSYDEGDYYQAIANGFWANWTDSDDVPISEFVATGIKAAKGEIPRSELSRQIRSSSSSAFYRHYHPPVAFYPPMVVRSVAPDLSLEKQLRFGTFALIILWILLLALLGLRSPDAFSPWFVLVPASANWIASACGFNMHVLFGLAFATTILCWYAYEKNRTDSTFKRLGIFFLAVTLCSVEYSLFLSGVLFLWTALTFWRMKGRRAAFLRVRLVDGLWLLGWMTLLWPGGTLRLGLLKSYALQAYIALFRLKEAGSSFDSFWNMLTWKWSQSPLEILLFVGAVLAILWGWREVLRRGSLFVSVLLVLAINYLQTNPVLNLRWYLFPAFAVVLLVFLHVLAERYGLSRTREGYAAIGLSAVLFVLAQFTVTIPYSSATRDISEIVRQQPAAPVIALQDLTPPLGAYLPDRTVRGLHPADFERQEIRDSLAIWANDHILVVNESIEIDARVVGTVNDVVVYAP